MLAAKNVTKRFAGVSALNAASIDVDQGEIVGLVGPNGSGKTTLLNALSGFLRPDEGEVSLSGRRIEGLPAWRIGRLGLRRTFQLPSPPGRMTVTEAMLCGGNLDRGASILGSLFGRGRTQREQDAALEKAHDLLLTLELGDLAHHPAASLSGGQQKLLGLGMALMGDPSVLLLDEPTAGVNPTLRRRLLERLREIRGAGTSLLVVEHDMEFVGALCDRVYVLDKGEVITCCAPEELHDDPRVVAAYLGTVAPLPPHVADDRLGER